MHWTEAVSRLRRERVAGVLVTVADVRGHAPREAGAKMVVSADATPGAASAAATSRRPRSPGRARRSSAGAPTPESLVVALSDKARTEHGRQCCGGEVTLLLEPLPVVPAVAVFGVGHVGLELARMLARHDLELHLVDSRADQLTDERLACLDDALATVHVHHAPVPELVLGSVPAGTHVLVLTHDHAEDFALCDAALRCAHLGSIGLIGSAAKWARFRQGLRVEGHAEDEIDRITTPIGGPRRWPARSPRSSRSPSPPRWSRSFAPTVDAERTAGDDLPGPGPRRPGRPVHRRLLRSYRRLRAGRWSTGSSWRAGRSPTYDTTTRTASWSTCATAGCCRAWWTPTCTTRRSGSSARWACRCWSGSTSAPCRRSSGWPPTTTPRGRGEEFCQSLVAAGTTTALVFGSHFAGAVDQLFTGRAAPRAAGHQRPGRQRPRPARAAAHHARARPRGVARARLPLARRRPGPLRRHAPLLALGQRGDARGLRRRASPTSAARGSPPTSTRTSPRWPRSPALRLRRPLHRHLRPRRPARRAVRARPQRARLRRRARPARRRGTRPSPTAPRATPRSAAGCSR